MTWPQALALTVIRRMPSGTVTSSMDYAGRSQQKRHTFDYGARVRRCPELIRAMITARSCQQSNTQLAFHSIAKIV